MIETAWREDLHAYLGGVAKRVGCIPIGVGGADDHVHLLLGLKPTQAIADVVRDIKKVSSTWAAETHFHGFAWQTGYGAFTFRYQDLEQLSEYVRNQEEHHRKISSADELRAILAEENIVFDERYFE